MFNRHKKVQPTQNIQPTQNTQPTVVQPLSPDVSVNDLSFNHVNTFNNSFNDSSPLHSAKETVSVIYTNTDCLTKAKKLELECMIHDKHPDIVAVTEIYQKNTSFENVSEIYNIEGYDSFLHDLKSGRGVIIYTIKNLNASELLINEKYNESVWLDVDLKGNDRLVIGCIYRSPNDQRENIQQLEKCINEVVMKNRSHLMIMGDFNLKEN